MLLRKLKLIPILLFIGILFLQYRLWFESDGLLETLRLKKELAKEQQINDNLKDRNEHLLSELRYVQKDQNAIEGRARNELGMIKKGETFYQIVR